MPADNQQIMEILDKNPIPGVDYADGLNRFGNQAAIYLRIINTFVKNTPALLDKLANPSSENIADYTVNVHGLKGSCYGISAMALGDEAKTLEFASKDLDIQAVQKGNPALLEHANTLISQLEALLATIEQGNAATADDRPLLDVPDKRLIARLLNATQDYDMNAIDKALEDLDQTRYSSNPNLVRDLREDFTNFKYDKLIKKAQQLLI